MAAAPDCCCWRMGLEEMRASPKAHSGSPRGSPAGLHAGAPLAVGNVAAGLIGAAAHLGMGVEGGSSRGSQEAAASGVC